MLVLAVIHFASARLSLLGGAAAGVVVPVWPASGIAVAALTLFGLRFWPAVALSALLANGLASEPLIVVVGAAAANTLEALVGAWLFRRFRLRASLERIVDAVGLLVVAAVAAAVAASIGTLGLWLGGLTRAGSAYLWGLWWLGDASGIALVAPLILLWGRRLSPGFRGRRIEGLFLLGAAAFSSCVVFSGWAGPPYLLFPFAIWAALRFGQQGAVLVTALVTVIAVPYSVRGAGPYPGSGLIERLVLVDGFLVVLALSGLIVAVVEGERARSRERYRLVVENSNDLISLLDRDGRVLYASPSHRHLLGYTVEECTGGQALDLVHPEDRAQVSQAIADGVPGGSAERSVVRVRRKDGSWLSADHSAALVRSGSGELSVLAIARDISARVQVEEALRASEERFRTLFESSPFGIAVGALDGRTLQANAAFEQLLGYTQAELAELRFADFTHPDDRADDVELFRELVEGKRSSYQLEKRYLHKDGAVCWVHLTVFTICDADDRPQFTIGMVENISERKGLEQQLRQAEKMEAIGQLAGGIAHDFNNLLLALRGYGELALLRLDRGDNAARADIEEIIRTADRAALLPRQLLAFSRRQILNPQVLNLNDTVADTEKLLGRLLGDDVTIVSALAADLGAVEADPGQIGQVLVNLAVNARDAMPDGGTLTIQTANAELDERAGQALDGAPAGQYVLLTVRDTGSGMDAVTTARAFEPFFTTKLVGAGSGLGLSSVYGIVKQSNGHITITSTPGEGATIAIYLPVSNKAKPTRQANVSNPIGADSANADILLVEDDDVVRSLLTEMLGEQGHRVTVAASPAEAISLTENGADYDLLITDVVMPHMNGPQLAKQLLTQRPTLKVIYLSGYASETIADRGILDDGTAFLQKPFTNTDLTAKIHQVLDTPTDQSHSPPPRNTGKYALRIGGATSGRAS